MQVVKAARSSVLRGRETYQTPARAKGRFVAVRLKLTNTGDEPLHSFYGAQLRIGDRYYAQDSQAGYLLGDIGTFPLQPGASGAVSVAFDVPEPAALKAEEGAVVLPGGGDSSVDYAGKIGALRLGHTGSMAATPAPDEQPPAGRHPRTRTAPA